MGVEEGPAGSPECPQSHCLVPLPATSTVRALLLMSLRTAWPPLAGPVGHGALVSSCGDGTQGSCWALPAL